MLKSKAKNLAGKDEAGGRGITKAEVRLHKSQHDCWSIFRGKVSWELCTHSTSYHRCQMKLRNVCARPNISTQYRFDVGLRQRVGGTQAYVRQRVLAYSYTAMYCCGMQPFSISDVRYHPPYRRAYTQLMAHSSVRSKDVSRCRRSGWRSTCRSRRIVVSGKGVCRF